MDLQAIIKALAARGILYTPGYEGGYVGNEYNPGLEGYFAANGRVLTNDEVAAQIGAPAAQLVAAVQAPDFVSQLNDASRAAGTYPKSSGGGFFSSILSLASDIGGGLTGAVANPVASALNVHPDVVKAAMAAAGMYYAGGLGFLDSAGNAITASQAAAATGVPEAALSNAAATGALDTAATAFPIGSAAAAAEGAAVPLTSTIAPAAIGAAAATPAVTNALSAADLAAASGAEGLAAPAATNALTTGVTAADLAAASGAEGLAAPAQLSSIAPGATAADLAWMDTVSPAQMAAIGTSELPGLSGFSISALAKLAKDYAVPLSVLASGLLGANASRSAAQTQADAARYAADQAYKVYQEQKALQEPFRTAGVTAQNQLLGLLGLPGGAQGPEFGKYARPFGMSDFQADPGYAFRLSEGMKALEASRAAGRNQTAGLLSGPTLKAIQRYGQEMGSQEYGNAFNRYQTERANRLAPLGSLMGTGQAAATNTVGAAGQYGTNVGNLTTDIGATLAGGQLGATRAITNALGQYTNYLSNQDLLNTARQIAQSRQSMYGG